MSILSNNHYLFTSESVGEGHPDKLCDQISDAILDACLEKDPESHVACETFASTALVLIGGELTTKTYVDFQQVARDVAKDIGYTNSDYGLDCNSMAVLNMIHAQSPDIDQGVEGRGLAEFKGLQGAGDQGMMFGFACNETPELMPAPIMYAHNLLHRATRLRKNKTIAWLRPDAKSQVTIEYEGHKPVRIDTVVISHQHDPEVSYETIKEGVIEGKGIIKWKNGNIYEGEVKKGKMNGYGKFIPKNGVPINGFFENGVRIDINNNINSSNININKDNIRFL